MARASESFPEIVTPRLWLRRFEARDLDGLHDCLGDVEAMRFWNLPVSKSKAETARCLSWLAKTSSSHDYLAWAVTDQAGDRCIGLVNYHHREARNKRIEIGYLLASAEQGRGLATEAVSAMLAYCTDKLGVHRMQATIDPANAASIRLVERLGFRCEGGPLRDYWRVEDRFVSVMMYARIAGDRPADGATARLARPKPGTLKRGRPRPA